MSTEKNNQASQDGFPDDSELPMAQDISDEDLARADLYGLLASLFYQAPTNDLLHRIAASAAYGNGQSAPQEADLTIAWQGLVDLAAQSNEKDWKSEYEEYFIGVGKPDIFLYGSYYLTGFLNEKPLVQLRHDLAAIGISGSESITETEDHIATLCEVMRYLIAGEDLGVSNLTQQKKFFNEHIRPWAELLFDAVQQKEEITHYQAVVSLAKAFFAIEGQAFDML
jgi:TorA maturation chaperone TorD